MHERIPVSADRDTMENVIIRKAGPGDEFGIARVHVRTWQNSFGEFVPPELLAQLNLNKSIMGWRRVLEQEDESKITIVAEYKGKIIAFISGGAEQTENKEGYAELYGIYVMDGYQRKGLGTKLTIKLINWLLSKDYRGMVHWVMQNNPFVKFYDLMGGEKLQVSREQSFGGRKFTETAYIWRDLNRFKNWLF